MTFTDLIEYCDSIESDHNVVSIVKQPFTRVLFSKAGRAGDIVNDHFKTAFKKQDINTIFYKDKSFKDFESSIFNAIKNESY